MPRWTGGTCPNCHVYMPENLIHCQSCRTLLNGDLKPGKVDVPKFVPLREISAMIEVEPAGCYVDCPDCKKELRINSKYLGMQVECKFCNGRFLLNPPRNISLKGFYTTCPHCSDELRMASKYLGEKVACKKCSGKLHVVQQAAESRSV